MFIHSSFGRHPHQRLLLYLFDHSHLGGLRQHRIVVLTCTSLQTNNIQYLIPSLLAICVPALEKYLFKSFAQVLIGLHFYYYGVVRLFYTFWLLDSSDRRFSRNFSHFVGCLHFLDKCPLKHRSVIFGVKFIYFFLCCLYFWCHI